MNELQTLRRMRESTPPPSDVSLSALRHDLLRETRARAPRRGFQLPRRPGAWPSRARSRSACSGRPPSSNAAKSPRRPSRSSSKRPRRSRAVDPAQLETLERPRDNQWIYQKTLWDVTATSLAGMSQFFLPENVPGEQEEWIRFDGKGWWDVRDGEATEVPLKPDFALRGNPAEVWDTWQTLPRDPRALLEETYELKFWVAPDLYVPQEDVSKDPRDRDKAAVQAISQLLSMGRGRTAPKDVQATLYRALGLIPDVEVVKGVKDVAGRDAIAVTFAPTSKVIILLDPVTYDYLGWGTELDDGKVTGGVALLKAAVVDKPGER